MSKNRDISLPVGHACFIMSSIWPAEFLVSTLFIICVMRWSVSVINVVRTVPIYSRPAIFFFCHTPNAWFTSVDVSLSSVNGRECLSANFLWLAGGVLADADYFISGIAHVGISVAQRACFCGASRSVVFGIKSKLSEACL